MSTDTETNQQVQGFGLGGALKMLSMFSADEDTRQVAALAGKRIAVLKARLEEIASNAPAKEPRDGPTVGWTGRQTDAGDAFDEAVQQAFNEGHTRACWEMAQIADAALSKAEGK